MFKSMRYLWMFTYTLADVLFTPFRWLWAALKFLMYLAGAAVVASVCYVAFSLYQGVAINSILASTTSLLLGLIS